MTRLLGVVFQSLKGKLFLAKNPGYRIDVGRITDYSYSKRLFMLTDSDKPFLLTIKYYNPYKTTILAPVFTTGFHMGFALTQTTEETKFVELRYNEEDLHNDIKLLDQNMKKIESFNKQRKDLLKKQFNKHKMLDPN